MDTLFQILSTALLLSFVFCCVASGFLQVRAWGRHVLPGVQVSLRALREPQHFFDPIGLRQMLLARRLLTIGGVAYVSYGLLIIVNNFR
jgi:hypothetical protein